SDCESLPSRDESLVSDCDVSSDPSFISDESLVSDEPGEDCVIPSDEPAPSRVELPIDTSPELELSSPFPSPDEHAAAPNSIATAANDVAVLRMVFVISVVSPPLIGV